MCDISMRYAKLGYAFCANPIFKYLFSAYLAVSLHWFSNIYTVTVVQSISFITKVSGSHVHSQKYHLGD